MRGRGPRQILRSQALRNQVLAGPTTEEQNIRLRKQILAELDYKIQATDTGFFLVLSPRIRLSHGKGGIEMDNDKVPMYVES